ncbi:mitochondrial K+-H+ exchange-related-domain-containing protein [Jimgerdemannia flammicorona]|uniref:Mitochondrial K+-H+ exchange-related-domain-containing protein n=1 Tax=Jimgerdemannia flammicorona TaxID=994334 RepID=A0A433DER3_9FUNG|nr:mitochondrial K+-H+ exchange-related-domain-containing protein [Jimgerdemannia flammicorona]
MTLSRTLHLAASVEPHPLRFFVVPILRSHWAYHCHSTLPSASRLTRAVDWATRKWETLGTAKPDTWKAKVYRTGGKLMDRVEYEEWFLKAIPIKEDVKEKLNRVPVHHPSTVPKDLIHERLDTLLTHRIPYHRKKMIYSSLWLPLTISFVVVPLVPNFPLAYNLFRIYSHYKAYKGAQHLHHLHTQNLLEYQPTATLDRCLNGLTPVTTDDLALPADVTPSNLSSLHDDIPGVIERARIAEIARVYDVPLLEKDVRRARFQVLARVVKERAEKTGHAGLGEAEKRKEGKEEKKGHI